MPSERIFDIKLLLILIGLSLYNVTFSQSCDSIPILKIGLIADPQYCDCEPAWGRYYRETMNKLPAAIDTLNKHKVDFVMSLGDMVDRYENSFDSVIQFYHELEMPYYNLLGNHEFSEVSDDYLLTLLTRYEMPNYFYDFSFGNWRFLVLDGTELGAFSRFLHPELTNEGDSLWQSVQGNINALPWNGGISRNQQSWMRTKLQEALNAEENVILFCHFPVYPDTLDNSLLNSSQIIEIMESYPNVAAYISGHQHEGSYGYKKEIHYLTQKAMVDSLDTNSFAILEIYSDEIRLKGYGNIRDAVFPYENIKKKVLNFELTDTILHYADHQQSFIGKLAPDTLTNYDHISYSMQNQVYENSYFTISYDSLLLNTEEDLSPLPEITIEVLATGCEIAPSSRLFHLTFDTTSARFRYPLTDTLLSIYDLYIIPKDSFVTDYSRNGLDYNVVIENPSVLSASVTISELIFDPIKVGSSKVELIISDDYTGKNYTYRFVIDVYDPLNHPPVENSLAPKNYYVLLYDTLEINLDTLFIDEDNDKLVFEYTFSDTTGFNAWLNDSLLCIYALSIAKTECEITADDQRGGISTSQITLSVNRTPERIVNYLPYLFQYNENCMEIGLDSLFNDPDGDTLRFKIADSDFPASVAGDSIIEICPVNSGSGAIRLLISDGKNGILNDSITIRFNAAPFAAHSEYFHEYTSGNENIFVDLDTIFNDTDNDPLTYSVSFTSSQVMAYDLTGSLLNMVPGDTLPSYMMISADDAFGGLDSARIHLVYVHRFLLTNDTQLKFQLIVYPNPTNDRITLLIGNNKQSHCDVSLTDISGKIILNTSFNLHGPATYEINVSDKNLNGVYMLRLEFPNGQIITKRIVYIG